MSLIVLVVVLNVVLVTLPMANALGTLDQQQAVIGTSDNLVSSYFDPYYLFLAQTFTAGLTGSLTEVDLAITYYLFPCSTCGPVTVEIHSGNPAGALLATTSLPYSAFPAPDAQGNAPTFTTFTYSSPASVVAGNVYAIVLTTSGTGLCLGPGNCLTYPYYKVGCTSGSNLYAAGTAWEKSDISIWSPQSNDLAFKTYVTMADYHGDFKSVQDNAATSNLGMIHFADTTVPVPGDYSLPQIALGVGEPGGPYTATIKYIPALGYRFLKWWTSGGASVADPNSQTTKLTLTSPDYTVTAVYELAYRPVGGVVAPTNKLEVLTPYLALAGLAAVVSTVVLVKRRRD